mgnify:CR=1 FL=1
MLPVLKYKICSAENILRVHTAMASKFGLRPGKAYDIETDEDKGMPWDFDVPKQRST